MRTLAKAIVETAAFLEFSSDDTIDPDDAVRQLESIAYTLHSASPEEVAAVREALKEMVDATQTESARASATTFADAFLESIGVES
jgi:hypothetical protein